MDRPWVGGEDGELVFNRCRVAVEEGEKVLMWTAEMAAQQCEWG